MANIHQTAIIDTAAEIDSDVVIGPFTIIDGPVRINAGTRIMSSAHISGRTVIGSNNVIHMGVIIGHDPQHLAYKGGDSGVIIGDGNVFREYVTIHRAYHPGQNTMIGNANYFMGSSHVAHDARVGNNVIVANGALLAGHTCIHDSANISGNVAVHQFVTIGRLAMIGGLTKIVKDVPPFMIADGPEGHIHGINSIGLRRAGFDAATRDKVKQAYRILYRSDMNYPNALEELEKQLGDVEPVRELIEFVRKSIRGITRHAPRQE